MGWTCPRCLHGVSPQVTVCPCGDSGSAGVTAVPPPAGPWRFPGTKITVTPPPATTVTYGGAIWYSDASTGAVTAGNVA
jgi:hypothetical protein